MSAISQKYTHRIEEDANFLKFQREVIYFPKGAEDFSVTAREGKMEIHALAPQDAPKFPYTFYLRTTGLLLDGKEGDYIGTISLCNGYFVGHLFKERSSSFSPINSKRIIYKYPIVDGDESKVILPESAQKLCTFVRREKPYVYAIVDPHHPTGVLPY